MSYDPTTSLRMPLDLKAQIREISEVDFTAFMLEAARKELAFIQKSKAPKA